MLETDAVKPTLRERLQRNLEEAADACPRCLTLLQRDGEHIDALEARAMSHIGTNRWDYYSHADHLTFIHRRRAIILHCDDHFFLQVQVSEINLDPRLRRVPAA